LVSKLKSAALASTSALHVQFFSGAHLQPWHLFLHGPHTAGLGEDYNYKMLSVGLRLSNLLQACMIYPNTLSLVDHPVELPFNVLLLRPCFGLALTPSLSMMTMMMTFQVLHFPLLNLPPRHRSVWSLIYWSCSSALSSRRRTALFTAPDPTRINWQVELRPIVRCEQGSKD